MTQKRSDCHIDRTMPRLRGLCDLQVAPVAPAHGFGSRAESFRPAAWCLPVRPTLPFDPFRLQPRAHIGSLRRRDGSF